MMGWSLFCGLCFSLASVGTVSSDSLKVERLLGGIPSDETVSNSIVYFAKGFQGTPYLGGTLEAFPSERLVVRTDSVDCTTFVEYVTALAMTHQEGIRTYSMFRKCLQQLRYREGKIRGYVSRLHYFSDWIQDNVQKGILEEVTLDSPHEYRSVSLNFMTTHVSSYPMLSANRQLVEELREVENKWQHFQMPYIPKNILGEGKKVLKINDGDILALATNIKGLDVVHVGFAFWVNGKLHLLHASSVKGKVWLDAVPLVDYSKRIKSHIGVRVLRFH